MTLLLHDVSNETQLIEGIEMSFSWSASTSPSFTGVKATSTNSFADALKRLAEHVEEKNKHNTSHGASPSLVPSALDFPTRMGSSQVSNAVTSEQALRLYTQYIQELERREDMRRSHLRAYAPSDSSSIGSPTSNRRLDGPDLYRFMASPTSGPFHPSTYFQSLTPQPRLPLASSCSLSNTKAADTASSIPLHEDTDDKSEPPPLRPSKPKAKLFRPYDLDSVHSEAQRTSPAPAVVMTKPAALADESHPIAPSGKEKQLFNSLGLVQQSSEILSEKSSFTETSPSFSASDESSSTETIPAQQDKQPDSFPSATKESSPSVVLKRKSSYSSNTKQSSHRKQSKNDTERSHH